MISEVRDALQALAAADGLSDPRALLRAVAHGTRNAHFEVLTPQDLDEIADELHLDVADTYEQGTA